MSNDVLFISYLRNNARETLTKISKKTRIPISTLYDKLRLNQNHIITKHTTLIDFSKLGYNCRASIALKVEREEREPIKEYLMKNTSVNNLFKINNGFDYLLDAVFRNVKEMEDFLDILQSKFKILEQKTHFIIEEIERENFLANPELIASKMLDY
jgi:DNA-binding Lrp family transcriptional regulator